MKAQGIDTARIKPDRFCNFVAIDWSGAAGERHAGIAIAHCALDGAAPRLVQGDRKWSRPDVLQFLAQDLPDNCLVGLDLGISLPFADCGAFFPGWDQSPPDARSLWAFIDHICAGDLHLGAGSMVDHPQASRYFRRHGGREGDLFQLPGTNHRRGRLRVTENQQAALGCAPYSNFNLVGAAQVGKSSLTGMRVLHKLGGAVPVWPIDPLPVSGSAIVEIYTTIAAIAAGRTAGRSKMNNYAELNAGLFTLGCPKMADGGQLDDHSADALLTAAWLRGAAFNPDFWRPKGLKNKIAQTEGWTFGAV